MSRGCEHCYAATRAARFGPVQGEWGPFARRVVASDATWREPERWNRKAADGAGPRPRVFCASLADVFEDYAGGKVVDHNLEPLYDSLTPVRARLFSLIAATRHLDWLVLTKRPGMIKGAVHYAAGAVVPSAGREMCRAWLAGSPPPNVWLGTSAEDQMRWDERVPQLLRVPSAVHFVSAEPLLGPIVMGEARPDWLIVGGESGAGARPMDPDWANELRYECAYSRVAFHFKQHGGESPAAKARNGRLLDGRIWDGLPARRRTVGRWGE